MDIGHHFCIDSVRCVKRYLSRTSNIARIGKRCQEGKHNYFGICERGKSPQTRSTETFFWGDVLFLGNQGELTLLEWIWVMGSIEDTQDVTCDKYVTIGISTANNKGRSNRDD